MPICLLFAAVLGVGCATTTAPTGTAEISATIQPMPEMAEDRGQSVDLVAKQLFVRGMTEAMIGNHEDALNLYTEALRLAPNTAAILAASAQSHEALGDQTSAIYSARKAVELDPDNIHNYFQLAQLHLSNGESQKAADVYVRLRRKFPKAPEALYELARIHAMNGSYSEAVAAYQELLGEVGNDRNIQNEILHLYVRMGDSAAMERLLTDMIATQPYDLQLRRMLGELYLKQGRSEEAVLQLKQALEQNAGDVEALLSLSDLYRTLGRADSADALLNRAANIEAATPAQLLAQAAALAARAEDADARKTAVQVLERLLRDDPENAEALVLLGDLFIAEERFSEAGELLYRAVQSNPRDPHLWIQAASALLQGGDLARAVDVADEGLMLFPGSLPLLRVSGYALMDAYQNDDAIGRFEEIVRIIREDSSEAETGLADLYSALGLLYNRTKDMEQSDRAYEQALATDPNHVTTLNNYAYSLAQRRARLDRALELAKRAVEINPDVASFLDTLGWIYFQRADYESALKWIRRAAENDDASASVLEHLGDVYQAIGDEQQAKNAWQRALQMDPDRDVLRDKLKSE